MLHVQTWAGAIQNPEISMEPPRVRPMQAATVHLFVLDQEQNGLV